MTKAYVETTILTNALLKPGTDKQVAALAAISSFDTSLLPVYAIKEWKAGPLRTYSYVHDKLVVTRSLAETLDAVSSLHPMRAYMKSTSLEAWTAATRLLEQSSGTVPTDELVDRYRLALATLIKTSWRKRRKITTETIQDLNCYTEAEPKIDKKGLFDFNPTKCERDCACHLAEALKSKPELLEKLRAAIPEDSSRTEDKKRRAALKLLLRAKGNFDRDACRELGDAVFAFFCPNDAVILTTNMRDHKVLAEALGKRAQSPTDAVAAT